ncbi:MAG: LysO family transporter [Muribaculaceae bacterium]|nr:LysO family transporter [Muribaculaceae bacterium]
MLKIVAIMFCGMGTGYVLRRKRLAFVPLTITVLIWLLLFFLGVDVGSNPSIIQAVSTLGAEALLLSFAGIAGSVALAWALWRWASRGKRNNQRQEGGDCS